MKGSASTGWPVWWLDNVVLVYSARPDKESICDALSEPALPAFRYLPLTRTQCLEFMLASPADFFPLWLCSALRGRVRRT